MGDSKAEQQFELTDLFSGEDEDRRVRILQVTLVVTAVISWLIVMWWASSQMMSRSQYGIIFLGLMILIFIIDQLIDTVREGKMAETALLSLLAVGTIISTIYLYIEFLPLVRTRVGYALPADYAVAVTMTFVIVYLAYRAYGLLFTGVFVLAVAYGLFGNFVPGVFQHSGYSTGRLMQILVTDVEGFYGNLTEIVAAWVALFLLYAGLLRGYDAFDLIIRVSFRAATLIKSGVAQSAVVASMIIGSVNGSAAANAAMTGSFTIPLMKKSGLKSESAGGIESVASSGGQLLPPVMGAGAFVMASILGITYWEVMTAGILPAIIFLIAVAVAVHYTASNQVNDVSLDISEHVDEMKNRNQLIWEGVRFLIPLALLIFILGYLRWTIMTAALYTVLMMIVTGITFPVIETLYTKNGTVAGTLRRELQNTVSGFVYGAQILAPIAIVIASINGIVDLFQMTGVPASLSLALLDLSGGSMLMTILLAMLICIILGLGMPTVAAYTIVAILVAPTLTQAFLLPDLSVHYFVFYSAILSGITPPIAIAVVVASGVAGANFWRTCLEALKIAAPLYVLPIAFIYNPEIVVGGLGFSTLASVAVTIGGAVAIVHGLNYVNFQLTSNKRVEWVIRFVFVAIGVVAMAHPEMAIRLGALGIAVAIYLFQLRAPDITPQEAA